METQSAGIKSRTTSGKAGTDAGTELSDDRQWRGYDPVLPAAPFRKPVRSPMEWDCHAGNREYESFSEAAQLGHESSS